MEGLASEDFSRFQQAPPGDKSQAKIMKEKQDKMAKRDEAVLKQKQLDAAATLIDVTRKSDESEERASLLRKIHAYTQKFPERLKQLSMTPAKESKADIEDLRHLVIDMEHELGKGTSARMLTSAHVLVLTQLESVSHKWNPLKLNLDQLQNVATANADKVLLPLWEEFAIKHADYFSTSVETRLVVATIEIIAATHRLNSQNARQTINKAVNTPANAEVLRKAAELSAQIK